MGTDKRPNEQTVVHKKEGKRSKKTAWRKSGARRTAKNEKRN